MQSTPVWLAVRRQTTKTEECETNGLLKTKQRHNSGLLTITTIGYISIVVRLLVEGDVIVTHFRVT